MSSALIAAFAASFLRYQGNRLQSRRDVADEDKYTLNIVSSGECGFTSHSPFFHFRNAEGIICPHPDWLLALSGEAHSQCTGSRLSPGLRAFALYVQAHYLYLKGEYGRSTRRPIFWRRGRSPARPPARTYWGLRRAPRPVGGCWSQRSSRTGQKIIRELLTSPIVSLPADVEFMIPW